MSEEVKDAEHTIPIGILGSVIACGSIGTVILIITFFCIQTNDIETDILGSKFGQPLAQIIFDVLGKWALTFMVLIAFAQFLMGASILTAISRQIWAFARDNGLPFSRIIKKVNKKLSVPINAVWFGGIMSIIIGLLVLIGTVATNALFTLYIAGKFWLGPVFSPLIGWTSTIFIVFTFFMVMFPANTNPDKDSMNYTCVITPSVWIFSLIYYYVYAHKIYHGPCKTIDDVDETSSEAGIDAVIDGVDPQGRQR
ncbi:hypothetical protein G9P44_005345 [Scheffersomyces stipitis]|nr:hypothetical protein G9P44_005345 [Scheffersomyces stipitis]